MPPLDSPPERAMKQEPIHDDLVPHVGGALIAVVGALGECLRDDVVDIAADVGVEL